MAAIFDGSDDSSEKKVRFDEIIQTYDTFPNHHHASLLENKKTRRKERSDVFWDADLRAEFDSWRNSPKMSKHRKKIQMTKAERLHKGQSLILRKFLVRKSSDTTTLPWTSSANSSANTSYDRPDILKHLNDTGFSSLENSPLPSPLDTVPPPVPARNSVRKVTKQKRPKITEANIEHSLRRYHSIDIGQALYEMESQQSTTSNTTFASDSSNVTTPNDASIEDNTTNYERNIKLTTQPATPPIRKISANSQKKLRQTEHTSKESIDQDGGYSENSPGQDIPDARVTQQKHLSVNHTASMRPRYKSMMNDNEIPLSYHPKSYLAQSGSLMSSSNKFKSLSTADLTNVVRQPSFTNYIQEIDRHNDKMKYNTANMNNNTMFTQKKKKIPSILRGVTSFFNTVRQKRTEDPYEHFFETSTLERSNPRKERKSIFDNFSLPRSNKKDFDELFDSVPIAGIYRPTLLNEHGSKTKKGSPPNIGFSNKRIDQTLRGTNQYVRDIEQQQRQLIERSQRPEEFNEIEKSPIPMGKIKDKERVDAFIW